MNRIRTFFKENMYFRLFAAFFKIGLFTFGGGMAMIPILQDKMCKEYKWMTEEEVVDCLAVSQSLPGVVAINMATYTGYFKKGFWGALAASLGVILPSFVIIILVVCFLQQVSENPYVTGAMKGITAAATGLIIYAAVRLGKQILKGPMQWCIAAAAFVIIALLGIDAVWVILGSLLIGVAYTAINMRKRPAAADQESRAESGAQEKSAKEKEEENR